MSVSGSIVGARRERRHLRARRGELTLEPLDLGGKLHGLRARRRGARPAARLGDAALRRGVPRVRLRRAARDFAAPAPAACALRHRCPRESSRRQRIVAAPVGQIARRRSSALALPAIGRVSIAAPAIGPRWQQHEVRTMKHRARLLFGLLAGRARAAPAAAQDYPTADHHLRLSVPGRRRHRHPHPPAGGGAAGQAQADGHRRQPRRRRHRGRGAGGRALAARRLHALARAGDDARDRAQHLQEPAL